MPFSVAPSAALMSRLPETFSVTVVVSFTSVSTMLLRILMSSARVMGSAGRKVPAAESVRYPRASNSPT